MMDANTTCIYKFNEMSEEGNVFLLPFETFILIFKPSISEKSISFTVLNT